jgi:hypothetical protein
MVHQWTSSSSFLVSWTKDEDAHWWVSSLEPVIEHSFSTMVFSESWAEASASASLSWRVETRPRNRRWFSRRAKTRPRNRRVLLSHRFTALTQLNNPPTRVSSKWKKNNFGSNRNKICFAFVSVCFVKPKTKFFGLFRCFEPISKQPKQAELFRNEPKQSGLFWKIPIKI